MHDYFTARSSFQRWADRRRTDPWIAEDAERVFRFSQRTDEQKPQEKQPTGPQRGRPELNTPNPVASVMPLLSFDRPQWVDDIVYGAVATAAGASKGRLNVKPGCVLAALHLAAVSTGAVKTADMSIRTAQTIAKAARHAAHGIAFYLDRHPAIRTRLMFE
ncbi:hypothetical protein ACQKQA_07025 [Pseudomonas sp. NPDC089530]|uniref:hypothetical protein n=1 Tax=Pseudomonas sp. NPDC089530 TaxID=3390651 RepID=UPI003D08A06D